MKRLANKRILLGVTGSIAAYKSAELVRRLREAGAEVQVVMTQAATEFITPLTLQALSGRPVSLHLLDTNEEASMGHINLARWADVIVIAPASANFIVRLAQGQADDLLSAICLASDVPLAVAPAMNRQMWEKDATQDNISVLKQRGVHLFGPGVGGQACGETGPGRMLEAEDIALKVADLFSPGSLDGIKLLITAGPTQEAIDPVRFISNRSSGKMGYAIAQAAVEAGALVTLISGPVALPAPERVNLIYVRSAEEMNEQVLANIEASRIFIATAAVADYRPQKYESNKIKKTDGLMSLQLEPTPDVLANVTALPSPPFTVGFAAETEDLEANALSKLKRKSLDMVAANLVGQRGEDGGYGRGFESDDNALTLYWSDGSVELPLAAKGKLARQLIEIVVERFNAKNSVESS